MLECDVLVVGAGPAGSSAARASALNGANVILIEKRELPGKIECGEAIGSYLIPFLPVKIPKNQLIWKTNGMSLNAENIHMERYGKLWEAYSIDRRKFDYWLAKEAEKAGVRVITDSELADLEHNKYFVEKAFVKKGKEKLEIKPKILIAADGAESTVLKSLDLYNPKKKDYAEIYSFELDNVNITNPYLEQIYIGDYINGGYGYIFPKSKNRVNIGVGSIFKQDLEKSFEEFCELPQIKKQIKNGKKVIEKSGKAPVVQYLNKNFYENVLITGDAACQNFKPYAEGILPGVICGDICGKTASLFLKSKVKLDLYEKKIKKKIGYLFSESDKITETLFDLFLMKEKKKYLLLLAFASNLFSYKEIEKIKRYEYSEIKNIIENRSAKTGLQGFKEDLQVSFMKFRNMLKK
jgi:digeranylgeranylglycerophospholipid reductase